MRSSKFLITIALFLSISQTALAFSPPPRVFNRDLYFGLRNDPDVIALQEFLKKEELYPGSVTGNYFSLTRKAVQKFQTREKIYPAGGRFGPKTRQRANELLMRPSANDQPISTAPVLSESSKPPSQLQSQPLQLQPPAPYQPLRQVDLVQLTAQLHVLADRTSLKVWVDESDSQNYELSVAIKDDLKKDFAYPPTIGKGMVVVTGLDPETTYYYQVRIQKSNRFAIYDSSVKTNTGISCNGSDVNGYLYLAGGGEVRCKNYFKKPVAISEITFVVHGQFPDLLTFYVKQRGVLLYQKQIQVSKGSVMPVPLPSVATVLWRDLELEPNGDEGPLVETMIVSNQPAYVTVKSIKYAVIDRSGYGYRNYKIYAYSSSIELNEPPAEVIRR